MCIVPLPVVMYILPSGANADNPNKVAKPLGKPGNTDTNESYVATVSCDAAIFAAVKSNW